MTKKIRIKDIALLANVSVGTVDRVIHNRGEVSEDSRKKVMDILAKMEYKPNLIARTLGTNKTYKIAALIPDPEQDEYWQMSAQGLKAAAEKWAQYGVHTVSYPSDLYNKDSFRELACQVLQSGPDAVLMAPIFHHEAVVFCNNCQAAGIPYAFFNNTIPQANPLTFIGQDLYQSGKLGAELLHMNQCGPGTFAILHIYDDIHNSLHLYEKEKGFKDYFAEQQGENFNVVSLDLSNLDEGTLEIKLLELLADTQLKGVLVTTSKGASTVSALLEKYGKNGKKLVAYDLLRKNLHYLQNGMIDFLINQNSKQQAFVGVSQLANHLLFKKTIEATSLFPLEVISKQNLDSYLSGVSPYYQPLIV